MLIIRQAQIAAMMAARMRGFERQAREHLLACFPSECAELGEPGLEQQVRRGIARAQGIGLESQADILRYLNLYFALGPYFDTLAGPPWVRNTLEQKELAPRTKLDLLVQQALLHLGGASEEGTEPAEPEQAEAEEDEPREFDGLVFDENAEAPPEFEEEGHEPVTDVWGPEVEPETEDATGEEFEELFQDEASTQRGGLG